MRTFVSVLYDIQGETRWNASLWLVSVVSRVNIPVRSISALKELTILSITSQLFIYNCTHSLSFDCSPIGPSRLPHKRYSSTNTQTHLILQPKPTSSFLSTQSRIAMAQPIEPPVTLSDESSAAMEVYNSVKVSLADLCAKGTAQYARKNYEEASDLYARASELQAELNGEMSPDNAEILFLYGRSLFKVGQSKSDVLGGKAGGEKKKKKKPNGATKVKKEAPKPEMQSESEQIAEAGVAIIAEQIGSGLKAEEEVDAKKPLFQFTGDENFEDSDDDAEVCLHLYLDILIANYL